MNAHALTLRTVRQTLDEHRNRNCNGSRASKTFILESFLGILVGKMFLKLDI